MKKEQPIIIGGGGIGGMTTALALSKRGYASIVLEQASEFRETGAGIQLSPNVFKIFNWLEIDQKMEEISSLPENIIFMDGIDGTCMFKVPLAENIKKRFGFTYGVLHREDLLKTLIQACKNSPLIDLRTSSKVVAYNDIEDRMIVILENNEELEGDAYIGAEGLWSETRLKIVNDGQPRASGDICYRGLIRKEEMPEKFRNNNVYLWSYPEAHFVHYPLKTGNVFNLVAVFVSQQFLDKHSHFGGPEELTARFKNCFEDLQQLVSLLNLNQKWMLFDREPVPNWSNGKVTLLGDAAHPTLPYMAQGAGLAIEDAYILAKSIESYARDYKNAFLAYQKDRYLRTARLQLTSRVIGEVQHYIGIKRELRNALLSSASNEDKYNWLAWLYEGVSM